MPIILLDTDVFSFLLKGDSRANAYVTLVQGHRLAVAFMTVAELFQWAAVRKWGVRRTTQLEQALAACLIVPVDVEMCRIWGRVRAERQSAGRPMAPQDAWIAAATLRHKLPLVTHSASDYAGIAALDLRTSPQP
jgi:tRNA(fMet)-specific endonuclease VapC